MALRLFLEAGTLLIKMWAPEHFRGGRLSHPHRSCRGTSERDDGARAPATICFSLDGRVYTQTACTAVAGCMEILQLRHSLISDCRFEIQRDVHVAATPLSSEMWLSQSSPCLSRPSPEWQRWGCILLPYMDSLGTALSTLSEGTPWSLEESTGFGVPRTWI